MKNLQRLRALVAFAALLFAGAAPSLAGTIMINGVCELGNCVSPDQLTSGGSSSLSLNTVFTLANTDQYQVVFDATPTETAGLTTLSIHAWSVTYLGNQTHTPSADDVILLDAAQDFQTPVESTGIQFTFSGLFFGPIADGSTAESTVVINGTPMVSVGPATAPGSFSLTSAVVPYTTTTDTNLERDYAFEFAAGSQVGAAIANAPGSIVPEPGSMLLLLGGAAALALRKRAR